MFLEVVFCVTEHTFSRSHRLGTTYSGAAFAFRHEYLRDQTKIFALKIGNPRLSFKCMTCILIKPDGKTCHSFGEEADSYYNEELDTTQRKEWYFFKRFKMELYNLQDMLLTRPIEFTFKGNEPVSSLELQGGHGKRLPALTVFSLSIQFLKDRIIDQCKSQLIDGVQEGEITWVLTVPAIWDDKAKAFMREAAERAGISREKLVMALEPESASIYCQHIPLMRDQKDIAKVVPFQPGVKYVILDCGGGTVDITVHEVIEGKSNGVLRIKEIHKARGNDMGGTKVDKAFLEYISSVVGEDVLQKYIETEEEDFREFLRAFEEKKRNVKQGGYTLTISTKLIQIFEKEKKISLKQHLEDIQNTDISTPVGKIRIENAVAQRYFQGSIKSIIGELRDIFSKEDTKDCQAIMMVGGYSESPLLQSRVREEFPDKNVICPNDAGLAVLKGAVIFGHNPAAICQRISKYTYGIALCSGEFGKLVEIDQPLLVGEANKTETYHPWNPNDTSVNIDVYTSSDKNPRNVCDQGCTKIGTFSLPMPDTTGGCDRKVTARMLFGGTEFIVEATDGNTGRVETLRVGCFD